MQGVGELFGSAFDDVIRRPAPAVIPAIADVLLVLAGAIVFATSVGEPSLAQAPQGLAAMPFSVPEALPSVADLRDATATVLAPGTLRAWLAVGAVAAFSIPVAAFARGGLVGALVEAYLPRRDDPLATPPEGPDALKDAFLRHGAASFGPLLILGAIESAVAIAAISLPGRVPFVRSSLLGLIAFDFLFIFAPYVVVLERRGALAAMRRSVGTVSDYLASSLVALLFGLLTTGGFGVLLAELVSLVGPAGIVAGAILYAPVGTVLSLFYLKVYVSLRPASRLPLRVVEAPAKAIAPVEA